MRHFFFIAITVAAVMLLISCNGKENNEMYSTLIRWDNLLENNHEAVSARLNTIDPHPLSRDNRAYYSQLDTISDDKDKFE